MSKHPFQVRFRGTFYAYGLYSREGKQYFTLKEAAQAAEEQYGEDWREVYNGQEAISREEMLQW